MKAKLLFLHALSPLHAGTGQGVGAIDLPIAREKATGIPIVPGSTLKGVLRSNCEADDTLKAKVFGPETDNAHEHAGSAQFSDLRLLFLPVRSLAGTFAWVTSPLLLQRLQRDCQMANTLFTSAIPAVQATDCLVSATSSQVLTNVNQEANNVILEDLLLKGTPSPAVDALLNWLKPLLFGADAAWGELFAERLCVVHDDVLSFLLDTATEITARIQLEKEKKTVARGALWYEEALPTESILSGLLVVQTVEASEADVMNVVTGVTRSPLQIGGNATVGRGVCRLHLT